MLQIWDRLLFYHQNIQIVMRQMFQLYQDAITISAEIRKARSVNYFYM